MLFHVRVSGHFLICTFFVEEIKIFVYSNHFASIHSTIHDCSVNIVNRACTKANCMCEFGAKSSLRTPLHSLFSSFTIIYAIRLDQYFRTSSDYNIWVQSYTLFQISAYSKNLHSAEESENSV